MHTFIQAGRFDGDQWNCENCTFLLELSSNPILISLQIVQTIESQDAPFSKLPKAQQSLVWNLTSSIINLLSSLSEAQDEIVESISKLPMVLKFLFGLLSVEFTPVEAQAEILSCLATLTEDNKPLAQQIVDNGDWLKSLVQIKDSGDLKAVIACAVLHNVFFTMQWFDHNTPMEGLSDAMLIPTLVQSLEITQVKSTSTNGYVARSKPDRILQLALEITASIATSLQEALEHESKNEKEFKGFDDNDFINGGGIEAMDADEGLGEVGNGGSDEVSEEEIDTDMDLVTGNGLEENGTLNEEVTLDRLVRNAAPTIFTLAKSKQSPSENGAVQSHALAALNNIAWTISTIDFSTGHLESLQKFWSSLAQRVWKEIICPVLASNTADIELASSITSLAWAVCRGAKRAIQMEGEEHRKFMALYQASKGLNPSLEHGEQSGAKRESEEANDAFQSLGVKAIGVLGSLALDPAPVDVNREIGVFLITILAALPDTAAADAVEALNQIFDIYADKNYAFDGPVFWGNGFYKHLEDIQPKVRKMAKAIDKRKFGELRSRADEAVLNLGRFLKYKRREKMSEDE